MMAKWKFRPHRGGLADAMAELALVDGMEGLLAHLEHIHPKCGPAFDPTVVSIKRYGHGIDERIGWYNTHVVQDPFWGVLGFCEIPFSWEEPMGEITVIPRRTWYGALLCRLGWHKYGPPTSITNVIPTSGALLVRKRIEASACLRLGCTAIRYKRYERDV